MDNMIKKWDCKVVQKRKLWLLISTGLIIIGLIFGLIFGGLNLGIDFTGGSIMSVTCGDLYVNDSYDTYKEAIEEVLEENGVKVEIVQRLSSSNNPGIQLRYQNKVNGVDANEDTMFDLNAKIKAGVQTKMEETLLKDKPATTNESMTKNLKITMSNVGATASGELVWKALLSIAVAAILILGYTAIRFEWLSGASAIIALTHDILIVLALMAIFQIQINTSFVAACITIVGYSINNTIVLFDRVRENKGEPHMRKAAPTELINVSIKETMTRSINTSITTLVTIVLLAIFGVPQIREFALPIIFGLLAGTYSSIFIAPPLWAYFKDLVNKKHEEKRHKYKQQVKAENSKK